MNTFQWVVLPVVGLLFADRLRAIGRGRGARPAALLWAMVWLLAGVAVAVPGLTTRVAELVGIRRGADFVFYCGILATFMGFFMTYARFRRLESDLTRLVRHLAMENPIPPAPDALPGGGRGEGGA